MIPFDQVTYPGPHDSASRDPLGRLMPRRYAIASGTISKRDREVSTTFPGRKIVVRVKDLAADKTVQLTSEPGEMRFSVLARAHAALDQLIKEP